MAASAQDPIVVELERSNRNGRVISREESAVAYATRLFKKNCNVSIKGWKNAYRDYTLTVEK